METTETNSNTEAINSTIDKIKYYSYLPAHIKGTTELDNLSFKQSIDNGSPAYVIGGSVTAISGRINIPDICKITRLYEINEPPLLIFN